MDPVIIIGGLSALAIGVIKKYWEKHKKRKAQMAEIRHALKIYANNYECEACDRKMIEECRNLCQNYFPYGIEETFNRMSSFDDQKTYAMHLVNDAARIMQVNLEGVECFEEETMLMGGYDRNTQVIYLNLYVLKKDPVEFVQTIFHELKHGVQHQALKDNRWGYSDERLALWSYTMKYYKNANICFEAYDNQSVEVDANKFADEVLGIDNNHYKNYDYEI